MSLLKRMVLYKHVNNTDVAFMPYKAIARRRDVVVKGRWFNIVNPKNVFSIGEDQIIIQRDHLENWKEFEPGLGEVQDA